MAFPRLQASMRFLKLATSFMKVIKDPSQTESIFDMNESLFGSEIGKASTDYILANPDVQSIIKERYLAPTPDLDELLKLPPESLGYVYASQMKEANFDPEFYRQVKVENDATYVLLRFRQTHDIWHMVTGFGTNPRGEVGLQAFYLAQTHAPLSALIIAGALINGIKNPQNLTPVMNSIFEGYQMGIKSKMFLAQKWEENWHKPLDEWRSELNIIPATA